MSRLRTYKTLAGAETVLTHRGFTRTASNNDKYNNPELWTHGNQTAWIAQQTARPHCFYIRVITHDDALPFDPPFQQTTAPGNRRRER